MGDPSLKKLKEEIILRERQNAELEHEVTRLRYSLQDKVGDNEAVNALQKELEIKGDQVKDRDDEIQALVEEKEEIEQEK